MIVFATMRLLFVIVNYKFLDGSFGHKLMIFPAALRLDASMAAYLTAVPFLFWLSYIAVQKNVLLVIARYCTLVFSVLVVFISLMNIGNYANWQTVINKRILLYFENPAEVTHFMSTMQLVLTPVLIIGICWLVIFFHKKFVKRRHDVKRSYASFGINFIIAPFLFFFMRGGLQTLPINESAAYYSLHESNDHAAVNPVYYFGHSVSEYYFLSDKYVFFSDDEAKKISSDLMRENTNDSIRLIELKKPNLVIIILESWTADLLEALGGEKDVTPFTNELMKESYLFTQCYGSGYRTDQGLVSVLAGYPSQPDNSIIAYPSKIQKLPSFCADVKKQNYHSSFFYGGDITFAEMKSFIVQQGFEYISDKENYDSKDYNSKWGAHDGMVLNSQIDYLNSKKEPFFSCVLTLSTHEPFEIPIKHKFPHDSDPNKFKNAAYYTDVCLKNYFAKAKKSKWYDNTLFLLVADHGHHLPKGRDLSKPESKRITCLLTGGALNKNLQGQKWEHATGQHDLIKMLAPYFKVDAKKYTFALDPFKANNPHAYYANENVLALITDSTRMIYEIQTKTLQGNKIEAEFAKAYLQVLYKDFTSR
jgi:phosphoglycerol transferase MdoB-like AlkP superfamily enzyme